MNKKDARIRRGKRSRSKMRELRVDRLSVHRSSRHIYAQVIAAETNEVLASASTLESAVSKDLASTGDDNLPYRGYVLPNGYGCGFVQRGQASKSTVGVRQACCLA